MPANCQGYVSCAASPVDSSLTDITLSLDAPRGLPCVESYEFTLNGASKLVGLDSLSATFTINKDLGLQYLNQQLFTLNSESTRGAISCNFSITGMYVHFIFYSLKEFP